MQLKNEFLLAVNDYFFLINKEYPVKSSLKIVGDHYNLNSIERNILLRGISSSIKIMERKKKKINEFEIEGKKVFIDGYNLIFTISNYYSGNFCFIAMDGFIRDCANIGGRNKKKLNFEKSVQIILSFFYELKPEKCIIYFDEPVSKSKEDITIFEKLLDDNKKYFDLVLVKNPDTILSNIDSEKIVITSDSVIIDKAKSRIFDLIKWYFEKNKIKLFSLEDLNL